MSAEPRLAELVFKQLDGRLSADEQQQLAEHIRRDPDARREYLELLATHSALHRHFAPVTLPDFEALTGDTCDAPGPPPPLPPADEAKVVTRSSLGNRLAAAIEWHRHPANFVVTVLVIGVFAWLGFGVLVNPWWGKTTAKKPHAGAPVERHVAQLMRTASAHWNDASDVYIDGAHLQSGYTLDLAAGLAEIKFDDGARVVLQGPARFEIAGADRGRLKQGRLVAHVPKPAIGFEIDTPTARVTDFGTEFGIEADDGRTDVHVLEGVVELVRLDHEVAVGQPIRLTAGASAAVDASTIRRIEPGDKTKQLVRSLPQQQKIGNLELLAHYRMGDDDPGAAVGAVAGPLLVDAAGRQRPAARAGSPRYVLAPDGGLAIEFSGEEGEHYSSPRVATLRTDNFCIDLWAKSDAAVRNAAIVWNGDLGYGILQRGGHWCGHLNNVGDIGLQPLEAGRWVHLALVRDNGVTTFYINGDATGASTGAPPEPTGRFWIGCTDDDYPFRGQIDEVRVFAFAPGEFRIDDLLSDQASESATQSISNEKN